MVTGLPIFRPLSVLMKLNTESAMLDKNNNNGMILLGFKTILHKKCRFGKNSEGPAENSWVLSSRMKTNFKKSAITQSLP